MTANHTISATFLIKTYTLSLTTVNAGTVTRNPEAAKYDSNTVVKLTATAKPGYRFSGWSGDTSGTGGGTANPLDVRMNRNKGITATFVAQYALSIDPAPVNGSVGKSPDLALYDSNTVVTLTALRNTGYYFNGWSGDTSGTFNPIDMKVNGNKKVSATFARITYALNVTAQHGTVTKSPAKAAYDSGTVVQLTAAAAPGYFFAGWKDDTVSIGESPRSADAQSVEYHS